MFVLDTIHLGVLQRLRGQEYEKLIARLSRYEQSNIFVTIVSFHEQIAGWTKYVKYSTDAARIVAGYHRLELILRDFSRAQVLPYSLASAEVYEELKSKGVRVATMDLRIASIAIANRMTLLTRNTVDFVRIASLSIEDWTS